MGNTLDRCCPTAATVRVYHGDNGHLLQFSCRPIPSVRLMRKYPNYLLVYTVVQARQTTAAVQGRVPQHHVHFRVVRPGEFLQIGQAYYLCFIPDQYRTAFAKYIISRRGSSATSTRLTARRNLSAGSPRSTNSTPSSGSPQYRPMVSPRPIRSYRRTSWTRWRYSIPPASPLYSTMRSPQSIRARTMSPRARYGVPSASFPLYSPTGSPHPTVRNRISSPRSSLLPLLSMDIPSPRIGRTQSGMTRHSTYIPSPLRGSPLETARVANEQHSSPNSEEGSSSIQSSAGLSPPSEEELVSYESIIIPHIEQNRKTLANMINEDRQRSTNRSMESPGRAMESPEGAILPLQHTTQRSIPYHNFPNRGHVLMRSPGRAIPPTQGRLKTILYHNLRHQSSGTDRLLQSPGRASPPTKDTLRSVLYRSLPDGMIANKVLGSRGSASSPGATQTSTTRNLNNRREKWSSPYYQNKSTRRSSESE